MATADSVISLMRTIAATPAVETSTRTYAGLLADKLEQRAVPDAFGGLFEEMFGREGWRL